MHISRIQLKNIRGFKELDFDLAHGLDEHGQAKYEGWIVFTGGNGAGKSTLLKAITLGLVEELYIQQLESKIENWIRRDVESAEITLNFITNQNDKEYEHLQKTEDSSSTTKFFRQNDGGKSLIREDNTSRLVGDITENGKKLEDLKRLTEKISESQKKLKAFQDMLKRLAKNDPTSEKFLAEIEKDLAMLEKEGESTAKSMEGTIAKQKKLNDLLTEIKDIHPEKDWFSCGYGPFRRVFGATQEASELMTRKVVERFVTLFQEAASLYEADRWLRDLRFKGLEGDVSAKLESDTVLELLRDEFMPNQITLKDVNSDGLWLEDRNGLQLAWRDMSDGYRAALALLVDILRHLIRKFGVNGLTARDTYGKLYIAHSGVVLIDEVDAHLHPEWQREISGWLKRHFPNIQFLVTTHSPLICQAADKIFVLPEPGSDELPCALSDAQLQELRASKSDAVLRSPAFGLEHTYSSVALANQDEFARLRSKQRAGKELSTEDKKRLEELSLFISADPDSEL